MFLQFFFDFFVFFCLNGPPLPSTLVTSFKISALALLGNPNQYMSIQVCKSSHLRMAAISKSFLLGIIIPIREPWGDLEQFFCELTWKSEFLIVGFSYVALSKNGSKLGVSIVSQKFQGLKVKKSYFFIAFLFSLNKKVWSFLLTSLRLWLFWVMDNISLWDKTREVSHTQ